MAEKVTKSKDEWRRELTPEQYHVTRAWDGAPLHGRILRREG
jgi:hypothetical protein